METNEHYHMIIAGVGLAGILFAAKYLSQYPGHRILLLDKEPVTGGKLADHSLESGANTKKKSFYPPGLTMISPRLFDYMQHSLYDLSGEKDPALPALQPLEKASILTAGHFSDFSWNDWRSNESFRIFGGNAALREWESFISLISEGLSEKDQNFSRLWQAGKKSAAIYALKSFLPFCGIPDPLKATPQAISVRYKSLQDGYYAGPWSMLRASNLNKLLKGADIKTSCRVVEARFENSRWALDTSKGSYFGGALVVAQHPSEALVWLDQHACPPPILLAGLKTRPASVVILNLTGPRLNLPTTPCFIPAEECYGLQTSEGSATLHTVIDYERSLDAPSVVKAIRRLRRAAKKLEKAAPEFSIGHEHLALAPVGWSYSGSPGEKKILEQLDPNNIQSRQLLFCGEAYGPSWNPDENLIRSVTSACNTLKRQEDQGET